MPWKVIESKHGEVVRTYERQTRMDGDPSRHQDRPA